MAGTRALSISISILFFVLDAISFGNSYLYRVDPRTDYYENLQEFFNEYDEKGREAQKQWPKTVEIEENWPAYIDNAILEFSGVAIDNNDKVNLIHRADRVWVAGASPEENSFNDDNIFNFIKNGPILNDTILVYDPENGALISSRGKNQFYMPHSITIDHEGNTWVTDVALHQVLKFSPDSEKPSLVLGEAFVPGKSDNHFCMPTKVVVATNGAFFVSDGYCNSRVLKFYPNGTLDQIIGTKDWLTIPHDLALDEDKNRLCVADRENYRVICYSAGLKANTRTGIPLQSINAPNMGRSYAIVLNGDNVFAAVGQSFLPDVPNQAILYANLPTKTLMKYWRPPQEMKQPHQMTISRDKKTLYLVDVDPNAAQKIFKLKLSDK